MFGLLKTLNAMTPPFWGTIFISQDIITDDDRSTFTSISYTGQYERRMYDRRTGWTKYNAYCFDAEFDDGLKFEVQVNPEFT